MIRLGFCINLVYVYLKNMTSKKNVQMLLYINYIFIYYFKWKVRIKMYTLKLNKCLD